MTGNQNLLSSIKFKDRGNVTFGDNNKGQVIGIGMVGNVSKPLIENVLLVKGLKYNLLSISQLCDKNYKIVFEKVDRREDFHVDFWFDDNRIFFI